MVRLGLQLTLRTGREAIVRLVLTAVAVSIGVSVLLAVLADYHAFNATSQRPCWECTVPAPAGASNAGSEFWKYTESIYQGRFIEVLDVAPLGPNAPVIPGLTRLPSAGQYYASPALAQLVKTVPSDELGQRFLGTEIGTVGGQALSGPTELVAVVGYSPAQLAALPGTIKIDRIVTAPDIQGTTGIYSLAFGIGAIVVLFPLLMLINTATRLAAAAPRRALRSHETGRRHPPPGQCHLYGRSGRGCAGRRSSRHGGLRRLAARPGHNLVFWGQVFRADRHAHGFGLCGRPGRGPGGGGRRLPMVPPSGEGFSARCQPQGDAPGAHTLAVGALAGRRTAVRGAPDRRV